MEIRQTKNNGQAVLFLAGRFDFNSYREFKQIYTPLLEDASIKSLEINLSGVDYLDSSALGMMLMLRERVQSSKKEVVLSSPSATVIKILEIANFNKLFTIK